MKQSGAVLPELAVMATFMVVVASGVFTYGNLTREFRIAREAARFGALAAVQSRAESGMAVTDVALSTTSSYLTQNGMNPRNYPVTIRNSAIQSDGVAVPAILIGVTTSKRCVSVILPLEAVTTLHDRVLDGTCG